MAGKLLQWLRGYLIIRLQGDYVERFFNVCKAHQIVLWKIERIDVGYQCRIRPCDFFELPKLLRKTETKVKIVKKCGLMFYIPFFKKRIIFFIGVVMCLSLLYVTTDYIWAVEYIGNSMISDDELTDFLREENIYYGMKKENLNCDEKEKRLREKFQNVTWTSIYFQGTKLFVELKENTPKDEEEKVTQGTDIVAEHSGTIVSVLTRNGVPKVKAGDEVEEGQILVEGSVPVYDESGNIIKYQIYDADADIYIRTLDSYADSVSKSYSVIEYYGKAKKGFFIEIPKFRMETPFFENPNLYYEILWEKKQVALLDNLYIPCYYGKIVRRTYHIQYYEYTDEELERQLADNFEKYILCLQEKGVQIIEKNGKIDKNRKGMKMEVQLQIVCRTGKSVSITAKEEQQKE